MKTFYITGCTAGLYPDDNRKRFMKLAKELKSAGAEKVTTVAEVEDQKQGFKNRIDARIEAVTNANCIVFTADWNESIESKIEFKEARRLSREIRFFNTSDIEDIKRTLNGDFVGSTHV